MRFSEGVRINAIFFEDDCVIRVGESCDEIIVSMEHGERDFVPWLEVWKDGQCVSMWNAAAVCGIEPQKIDYSGYSEHL